MTTQTLVQSTKALGYSFTALSGLIAGTASAALSILLLAVMAF